jgi:uncharacterized protein YuzE
MNNSVIIDVGEKGKLIGIEILNFSHQQNSKDSNLSGLVKHGVPLQITESTPTMA